MKLRNKKTGEIGYTAVLHSKAIIVMDENAIQLGSYTSLAELNEEWEDYEEPKEYWYIENNGDIDKETYDGDAYEEKMIEIGNYFETKEEAEKAVAKLKSFKRLKDKGFKFNSYHTSAGEIYFNMTIPRDALDEFTKDMDTCFGGEE